MIVLKHKQWKLENIHYIEGNKFTATMLIINNHTDTIIESLLIFQQWLLVSKSTIADKYIFNFASNWNN